MRRQRSGVGRDCLVVAPPALGGSWVERLAGLRFEALLVTTEGEALETLGGRPFAFALVSNRLGPVAVQSLCARAAHVHPDVPVVVVGESTSVQEAVDAMQRGAADYLVPGTDDATLAARLQTLLGKQAQPTSSPHEVGASAGLVGSSPSLQRVLAAIDKISRYKTNVLLLGESGTGKELIARALHARGPRRKHLFVPMNCATLGRELLENELFGHEKGAFTGATERKKGLFELADGGTLFLDEIGEMDPSTQAKLLRVLERNEFRRVGGTTKVRVDLSVIAATHVNLEAAIAAGKFREDLYYRLKVVSVVVPPLRDRREDIPALIDAFIADFNRRNGGKIEGVAPQALKAMMEYPWPGNVRELKHAVESAAILATGPILGLACFPDLRPEPASSPRPASAARGASSVEAGLSLPWGITVADAERQLILGTVARCRTKREAARVLGLGLRTLYTKLDAYAGRQR